MNVDNLPTPAEVQLHLEAVRAELATRSLKRFFVDFAWPVLQPGTVYVDNWHVDAICDHLEAVTRGEIKRLLINMPFRMLKSTLITQTWPAWEWLTRPSLQYMTASYARDVATRDAVDSRRIIESEKFQRVFGQLFRMTGDQNVKTRYENDRKGSRVITATEAAGTGFGGNRIIVDDPVSAKQADSDVARAASIEWWKGTAATRLNNPEEDAIVVVQQRLHADDLSGYILAEEAGLGWEHLVLPMRYEAAHTKTTRLGFADPRTKEGEVLSAGRLSDKTVAEMEARLGKYHTAAQLQQRPGARGGTMFKASNWRRYHAPPKTMARDMEEIIWSWDMTFKGSASSDNVGAVCIGRKGADKYILHALGEKMTFSRSATLLAELYNDPRFKTRTVAVLVEDKANGPAIVDHLKSVVPGLLAISPNGGKLARASAILPQHEAGNLYLPAPNLPGCSWVEAFEDEFSRFNGKDGGVDDQVDATTQGVSWFTSREHQETESPKPATAGARVH